MIRACEKRPVPLAELEKIAEEIEQDLQNSMEREVSTEAIGEKVMERLRDVDQVAYVRFASVVPPVQGYRHLHGGAEQAPGGQPLTGPHRIFRMSSRSISARRRS